LVQAITRKYFVGWSEEGHSDGMWTKCSGCSEIIHKKELDINLFTCPKCNFHFRIGSKEYFEILLDAGTFKEMNKKMRSVDPLKFTDTNRMQAVWTRQ